MSVSESSRAFKLLPGYLAVAKPNRRDVTVWTNNSYSWKTAIKWLRHRHDKYSIREIGINEGAVGKETEFETAEISVVEIDPRERNTAEVFVLVVFRRFDLFERQAGAADYYSCYVGIGEIAVFEIASEKFCSR